MGEDILRDLEKRIEQVSKESINKNKEIIYKIIDMVNAGDTDIVSLISDLCFIVRQNMICDEEKRKQNEITLEQVSFVENEIFKTINLINDSVDKETNLYSVLLAAFASLSMVYYVGMANMGMKNN